MKYPLCFCLVLLLAACDEKTNNIDITKSCFLEFPSVASVQPAAQEFNVSGWAYDKLTNTAPEHVRIQISSTNRQFRKTFEAKRGTKRPDVVNAFNAPGAELSGFDLVVPANSLPPGDYNFVIFQEAQDSVLACSSDTVLQVK